MHKFVESYYTQRLIEMALFLYGVRNIHDFAIILFGSGSHE